MLSASCSAVRVWRRVDSLNHRYNIIHGVFHRMCDLNLLEPQIRSYEASAAYEAAADFMTHPPALGSEGCALVCFHRTN